MKKTLLLGTIAACGALTVLPSCDESMFTGSGSDNTGHIIPTVSVDSKVTSSQKNVQSKAVESRTDAPSVSLDQLVLTLTASDGTVAYTCTGVDNFPADKDFKVGTYTFSASYGDPKNEGFDLPAYYGSTEIKVEEDKTTSVSLQASLANSMVSIAFGESLLDYATDVSAALQTTGDDIAFSTTEDRAAYIYPGMTAVKVTLTKPNGASGTLTAATFTAKARTHHTVKIDIAGGAGDATLTVTFDDTVEEEDVEIDLTDDILNAPAPEVTLNGFESGEAVSFIPGLSSTGEMSMDIIAKATLKSVMMTTTGNALLQKGWPESIDLMQASEAQQQHLKALGLEVLGLYRNPEKMAVIDLTDVPKNIAYSDNTGNVEITFVVYDHGSKSSDPVTLVLAPKPLQLELTANTPYYPGAGQDMEFTLTFNGNDPADELTFQINNARGTWSNVTPKSVEAVTGQENTFKVIITAPDTEDDVKVRVYCQALSKYSNEVAIKQVPFQLQGNDNDVWATHATLKAVVTDDSYDAATVAQSGFRLTPAEGSTSIADGVITLTGLTPGKTYKAVITYDDMTSRPFEFTTEEALQLPESGFDNWTSEKKGNYQYLWTIGDGGTWGTVNDLTISSYGSGSGNGLSTGGCAYKATSGTIPANGRSTYSNSYGGLIGTTSRADGHTTGVDNLHSDKAFTGANAALIRTVGYGSGNSAGSGTGNPASGFSNCQNVASGELFTGTKSNGVYEGLSFGSRPSGIEYYFKYAPFYAADYGYFEAYVVDDSDNVISEKIQQQINITDQYTKASFNFNYTVNKKAAKIIIRFLSSGNPDLASSSTWLYGPGNKNVSGGEYVGSELYIDDVQLTY